MIELRNVTKRYGAVEAVKELSLRAPEGEVVGLLGQNGAGKTTTLNMLTGYFPPTSGQVLVDGVDMLTDPRGCKRRIGYLPERPPLYDEMTVEAYLTFACRLKEVEKASIARHVRDIMHLCGLEEVAQRTLGHLSKGYRQRAGVAQALCGDPPVLVLDEPTVGLDPRQVVEIRDLIRNLGKDHTIVFSSHILAEVQQLCQRVAILHHGRLVREMELGHINAQDSVVRLRASIALGEHALLPALKSLPCVRRVKALPSWNTQVSEVELECVCQEGADDPQTQLFHLLCAMDAPLRLLLPQQDTLEEVFLRVTADDSLAEEVHDA